MSKQTEDQLTKAKAKLAKIVASMAAEMLNVLAHLPAQYGFQDAKSFAKAVKAAEKAKKTGKPGQSPAPSSSKRTRAKITDETRAKVKTLVSEKMTGAAIAKTLGISLPSVQNIKKTLGLVKARK
jgi:hypothetical protein